MTKGECIALLNTAGAKEIIYNYCIHKGKKEDLVDLFMIALSMRNSIGFYYEYAFNELCKEFNLTILSDKSGNVIEVY